MPFLDAKSRAGLPDTAFAYVDSRGRRRLPINDEAHVRNALSRFSQTPFEDEAAREKARTRLLRAAKKYGIVPVGFVTGQLRSERVLGEIGARAGEARTLPTGLITLLLADIEDSTGLVRRLGKRYAPVLTEVRRILRAAIRASDGREIDARADEMFAVFARAEAALEAALAVQRRMLSRAWPEQNQVRIRVGLHSGRPTLTDSGYVGMVVNTAARVCFAGRGGQIVLSTQTVDALRASAASNVTFKDLGLHRLHGLPAPVALFQVVVDDLPSEFAPPRTQPVSLASALRPAGEEISRQTRRRPAPERPQD